jgi:hypothetical protein
MDSIEEGIIGNEEDQRYTPVMMPHFLRELQTLIQVKSDSRRDSSWISYPKEVAAPPTGMKADEECAPT